MFKYTVICAALFAPLSAHATNEEDMRAMREQMQQMELRLQQAESTAQQASRPAASSEGAFNPAIALILSGTYGQFRQDAAIAPTGFAMNPSNTGYLRSFSLQESELSIAANIDPQFRGVATISLDPAGGVSVENGYVQSTTLGNGLNLKFGRYFSGLGYLNEQHAHAWDFVDQPLVYRTLWDNQLGEDGVQLKWLAPADMFIELGGEIGRGRGFPGSDRQNKNGAGSGVLFAHFGDDIGIEHSWRAGLSVHQTKRENASSDNVPDLHSKLVSNRFSGDSHTAGVDFVWKYSPDGNFRERYLKLQGEYFRRNESGTLTYDTGNASAGATPSSYSVTQSGWYLQSVYQFRPAWRTGLRYDRLDPGTANVGADNAANVISNYAFNPSRLTWMTDYNPSEFTRLRLQLAHDNSRQGLADKQLFVQYIMSLGAHGAHQY